MRFIAIFCFLLVYICPCLAQNKQDYIWHFGQDQNLEQEGVQASQIDFNEEEIRPRIREGGLQFDQNNASICDKDGNLLIYTNGCAVANRLGEVMPNGHNINEGAFFDDFWFGDCAFGYPGRQDIMILPDPVDSNQYYIIHKINELVGDIIFIKYSKVDLSLDNGLGDVTEKNVTFFEGVPQYSYLTAISHSNKKDYWVINPKRNDNVYHRFLLSENGIENQGDLKIGKVFNDNASAAGDAKFSPDGTKYAIYNNIDGLQIFDFDRSTGEFSNPQLYETEGDDASFSTIEFSSNSRFLYIMDYLNLWQMDLEDPDPQSSIVLIDQYNGTQDPFGTSFFLSALAPDCKIYVRGGNGTNSFHVIREPNKKGVACDFKQNIVRFPLITARGGFPNFPRFRVDDEQKCDSTLLTSSLSQIDWEQRELSIYPNPARDLVNLTIQDQKAGRVLIYNMEGRKQIDQMIALYDLSPNTIDVSSLSLGSYVVEFIPSSSKDRIFYQGRLQVVR